LKTKTQSLLEINMALLNDYSSLSLAKEIAEKFDSIPEQSNLFLGSHFPLKVLTNNTNDPQDVRGKLLANQVLGTKANLWGEKGWAIVGGTDSTNRTLFTLNDSPNINTNCVMLAMTLSLKEFDETLMFFAGNTLNQYGFMLGVTAQAIRTYIRDGISNNLHSDSLMPIPIDSEHKVMWAFDGPNRGCYIWFDGILVYGVSANAWANPAHSSLTTALAIGGQAPTAAVTGMRMRIKDLCYAQLPALPVNLNQIAAAYNSNPGGGFFGAQF